MSCFWDAIHRELTATEKTRAGLTASSYAPRDFVVALQQAAAHSFVLVRWQGSHIDEDERRAHALAVRAYCPLAVDQGYDCGACDSFLLALSQVAGVHIRHTSSHGTFEYTSPHPGARWMELKSNSTHMF
jgi:hypothetical protein